MPEIVIDARKASIGFRLMANRILPYRMRRKVGPFIFMDHAGYEERAVYIAQGSFEHKRHFYTTNQLIDHKWLLIMSF